MCFIVCKANSRLERAILTTLYFIGAENFDTIVKVEEERFFLKKSRSP
jgi:hypothetical protein